MNKIFTLQLSFHNKQKITEFAFQGLWLLTSLSFCLVCQTLWDESSDVTYLPSEKSKREKEREDGKVKELHWTKPSYL